MKTYTSDLKRGRKNWFCSQLCNGKYQSIKLKKELKETECSFCHIKFRKKLRKNKNNTYFCSRQCLGKSRKKIKTSIKKLGELDQKTKGQLIEELGYFGARSSIQTHARKKKRNLNCYVCDYSIYCEVCHIKAVKDFPNSALICEINAVENLVELCPNHHWEMDNNLFCVYKPKLL